MRPIMTFAEYLALRSTEEMRPQKEPVVERSLMAGVFKAVNPARPVLPTNSRLLAPPGQKRFKSQVIGR